MGLASHAALETCVLAHFVCPLVSNLFSSFSYFVRDSFLPAVRDDNAACVGMSVEQVVTCACSLAADAFIRLLQFYSLCQMKHFYS
jgi:hypothetical protein